MAEFFLNIFSLILIFSCGILLTWYGYIVGGRLLVLALTGKKTKGVIARRNPNYELISNDADFFKIEYEVDNKQYDTDVEFLVCFNRNKWLGKNCTVFYSRKNPKKSSSTAFFRWHFFGSMIMLVGVFVTWFSFFLAAVL